MLSKRQATILEAAVRDFIATGEPVSSEGLYERYDFGVKPATIRNELHALSETGCLDQPHTSGGRVPTDKGYEFYVTRRLELQATRSKRAIVRIIEYLEEDLHRDTLDNFVADFANRLGVLGVGYNPSEPRVYKSGLQELVMDMRYRDVEDLFEIIGDFESIDRRLKQLPQHVDDEPRVFIGQSPITKSPQLSVIANRYDINGKELILIAIGPKRMDYERNISFFKELKYYINQ